MTPLMPPRVLANETFEALLKTGWGTPTMEAAIVAARLEIAQMLRERAGQEDDKYIDAWLLWRKRGASAKSPKGLLLRRLADQIDPTTGEEP